MSVTSRWRRVPPLPVLLLATAALYLWGLSSSGWANAYYSAAAQAGSESWRAFFFGSFDAAGSITVDKPPLAVWPMALSVRIFGLSSWSILVPQALAGVATVAVVHAAVRRATGSAGAALLAGAALALTPVAVLMFRFNNPDALLVLLMVGAAAATLRAVESTRAEVGHPAVWLALGGSLVGLAFLTKMLQAFLVLPALALTYALFAAVPWGRRLAHLGVAAAATIIAGSWWLVAVELWPSGRWGPRPYIGGSQHDSVLELMLGYNGVGRLSGDQVGSVSNGGGWGTNSFGRLLDPATGSQAAWLLPGAIVLAVAALRLTRDDPGDLAARVRPAITLWLTWTVVTFLTFSLMNGIFHDYYTVALAPAVASLTGLGGLVVWRNRASPSGARALGTAVAATGAMAMVVLIGQRDRVPWLPWLVAGVLVVAASQFVGARRRALPLGTGFMVAALVAAFTGPAAYSVVTVTTPHTGAVPYAGPSRDGQPGVGTSPPSGVGDLLRASTASPALTALLVEDADSYSWVAAVTGANSAAGFQLATDRPVMPVGGFNGTDPSPSLRSFKRLVRQQRIHFYVAGGGRLVPKEGEDLEELVRTGSDDALLIARWVRRTFERHVVDGVHLYDLSAPIEDGIVQPSDG